MPLNATMPIAASGGQIGQAGRDTGQRCANRHRHHRNNGKTHDGTARKPSIAMTLSDGNDIVNVSRNPHHPDS
jgi:hypothetical protein